MPFFFYKSRTDPLLDFIWYVYFTWFDILFDILFDMMCILYEKKSFDFFHIWKFKKLDLSFTKKWKC